MICIKKDVMDPTERPLLLAKSFVTNADGSTSILMPDGTFAYQEPNWYGLFKFASTPLGAYQHCIVQGQLVSFWTRPQDPPYVYTWVELPN